QNLLAYFRRRPSLCRAKIRNRLIGIDLIHQLPSHVLVGKSHRVTGLMPDYSVEFGFGYIHRFMCDRIRARRSAEGLSRNPTVKRRPATPQYFVVRTEICSGVGLNPATTRTSRSTGG